MLNADLAKTSFSMGNEMRPGGVLLLDGALGKGVEEAVQVA